MPGAIAAAMACMVAATTRPAWRSFSSCSSLPMVMGRTLAAAPPMVSASSPMSEPSLDRPRKFLVVVDKTPEARVAVRFAARRAQHTGGRVTLLCCAQPADFQQWRGVEEIMKDEAHQEAERLIY